MPPEMRPTTTGIGIDVAERLSDTCEHVSVNDTLDASTYSADEDDRLEPLAQDRNERKDEKRPFTALSFLSILSGQRPVLGAMIRGCLRLRLFESRGKLETPFDARAVHLEEGDAHEEDDDARDD